MELFLQRGDPTPKSIPGELTIGVHHVGWTLERPGVCILAGRYQVLLYNSPHFGRLMPWLQVPTRAYILMHWGNYPQASDGCVLVGEQRSTDAIWHTQEEFLQLFTMIEAAVGAEGCWLTVADPPVLSNAEQVQEATTAEN